MTDGLSVLLVRLKARSREVDAANEQELASILAAAARP